MPEQLASLCAAEEEVTRLREVLEKVQLETRQLRRERFNSFPRHQTVTDAVNPLVAALKEHRTQNALHLMEQMEILHRELEEREQVLQGLQDMQVGSRVEERRRRSEEEEVIRQELQCSQHQEALQLSRSEAELQLANERNAEFQEEVLLLQETVRRECEEREELTAALSHAQAELLGLRSPASHQGSSVSPPNPSREKASPSPKSNPSSSLWLFELAKHTAGPRLPSQTKTETRGQVEEEQGGVWSLGMERKKGAR
ncbi:protein LEKR1 [Pungitius pungitius]|uniref:protein LEKR1 n=1 Tax=Pungitius pungitius TaxID=134920 RepID=UPI002E0E6AC0